MLTIMDIIEAYQKFVDAAQVLQSSIDLLEPRTIDAEANVSMMQRHMEKIRAEIDGLESCMMEVK